VETMKKVLGVLVVVLLAVGLFSVLNASDQSTSGLVVAKTVDAKPVCEPGDVKDLKAIDAFGLKGSEYLLCSEKGEWTGPQKSTKSVDVVAAENKVVQSFVAYIE